MRAALLAATAAIGLAAGSHAAAACFTKLEVEAAEAVLFHTRLMLGGLACQDFTTGEDTYEQYKAFTREHEPVLAEYEEVMINRFARMGEDNPVAAFDLYRTELANHLAEEMADKPIRYYCAGQTAELDAWLELPTEQVERYIRRLSFIETEDYDVCEG